MIYRTYQSILSEIEAELDLKGELFIDPAEMMDYVNKAIAEAEAHIHKLNAEDAYFETSAPLTLIQGQSEYDPPADIYASKIKRIVYSENNSRIFPIQQLKNTDRYIDAAVIDSTIGTTAIYQYMLTNASAASGVKIHLYPAAQVSGQYVTIWYIREANKIVDETSLVDIPQFYYFITQYVKWKVCAKETHPNTAMEYAELDRVRKLMIETLENRVPDENNQIEMDMSFYKEMS